MRRDSSAESQPRLNVFTFASETQNPNAAGRCDGEKKAGCERRALGAQSAALALIVSDTREGGIIEVNGARLLKPADYELANLISARAPGSTSRRPIL